MDHDRIDGLLHSMLLMRVMGIMSENLLGYGWTWLQARQNH